MKERTREYVIETSLPLIEVDEDGNLPVMTTTQRNKASVMIRNECADYGHGSCLPLGCKCPQCNSFTVLCRYFRHVLLKSGSIPGAKTLEAEIFKGNPVKTCKECGRPFIPKSGHTKYCPSCVDVVRRRKVAASARKSRAKNKGKA